MTPARSVGQEPGRSSLRHLSVLIALVMIYVATRVYALCLMPLYFDEEVHLTRAIEVWHGHPFWDISDGRIINQWAIAAFYPQNAPVFAARIATVLVALPGFAAGYAVARRWFGRTAGLLAAGVWITCPYLFFYERTAMIDAEAGALAVVAIWASLRLIQTGRRQDALLTGLALAIAMLFKFTAVPFVGSVGLIVLFLGKVPWRQRLENFALIGLVILTCFTVPLLYAATHQGFSVVFGWLAGSGGRGLTWAWNLETLWAQVVDYGTVIWSLFFGVGLLGIIVGHPPASFRSRGLRGRRDIYLLLSASALPLAVILVLVAFVMPRHFVVGVPILLTLAGGGLGILIDQVPRAAPRFGWLVPALTSVATILLVLGIIPFARLAYTSPGALPLPPLERGQYLTGYSAGFGLREAVLDFPRTVGPVGTPIVASMYPDGCRLANFYDTWGYHMRCVDAPGLEVIQSTLAAQPVNGTVYVLAEAQPIGLNPAWMMALPQVKVTRVTGYARPGETADTASVVLWQIEKISAHD